MSIDLVDWGHKGVQHTVSVWLKSREMAAFTFIQKQGAISPVSHAHCREGEHIVLLPSTQSVLAEQLLQLIASIFCRASMIRGWACEFLLPAQHYTAHLPTGKGCMFGEQVVPFYSCQTTARKRGRLQFFSHHHSVSPSLFPSKAVKKVNPNA